MTHPPAIRVTVTPVETGASTYRFTVRNNGPVGVIHLKVYTGGVLGLGEFGLDDTHMSMEKGWPPPVFIERLAAGEESSVIQGRHSSLFNYGGPRSLLVSTEFRTENSGSEQPSRGQAQVLIIGPASRVQFHLSAVPTGMLLRKLLPVALLAILGVLAVAFIASGKIAL